MPPPFDPRQDSAQPPPIPVAIIERWADYITADPQYRLLFEELFKHILLLPPLLLMSILLHFVSPYLGPQQDRFAAAEHFLIQCISFALVFFASLTVAVTLLDAGIHVKRDTVCYQPLNAIV